ncbi:MAG: hypothetical protein HY600_05710 [Candidatus Omnitrophica bacterium]|nr:hypothetical protein [Candidatus Omnitrophota bacterium]
MTLVLIGVGTVSAEAASLKTAAQASGGDQAATTSHGWAVVGEPVVGQSASGRYTATLGFLASWPGPASRLPPLAVTVNEGAPVTNRQTITLAFSVTGKGGPIRQIQFSHDGVIYAPPEPYEPTKSWTVLPGDGVKTIYFRVGDGFGGWSDPLTATISIDTTAPSLAITAPKDGAVLGAL